MLTDNPPPRTDRGPEWNGTAVTSPRQDRGTPLVRWWIVRAAIADVVSVSVALLVAPLLRFGTVDLSSQPIPYEIAAPAIGVAWLLALVFCGAHAHKVALHGFEEARSIVRAAVVLLATIGFAYFVDQFALSRGYVAVFVPAAVLLTSLGRWVLRRRLRHRQARGLTCHRAVLVGPVAELARLEPLVSTGTGPVRVVATVSEDGFAIADVCRAVEELRAGGDAVFDLIMRAGQPADEESWALAELAGRLGVDLAVAPRHDDDANLVFSYVPLGATPVLLVESGYLRPTHRLVKAVLDWCFAFVAVVLLSPLLLLVAAVVLVRDGRPVFFRQERVGHRGRRFTMLKFRTMVHDAEDHLAALRVANEADGPLFKLRADPRVTRTGAFLRRWSLDELPQLFNVLRGQMAMVGPRPPLPSEVDTYDRRTARRLLVKPGITGMWQVEGRAGLHWDEAVYLDLLYVDHWSPLLDLAILLRTIRAVARGDGAY